MVLTELVIMEDVLCRKQLVGTVLKETGGVFKSVDIMPAGPDFKVAEMSAKADLIRHAEFP